MPTCRIALGRARPSAAAVASGGLDRADAADERRGSVGVLELLRVAATTRITPRTVSTGSARVGYHWIRFDDLELRGAPAEARARSRAARRRPDDARSRSAVTRAALALPAAHDRPAPPDHAQEEVFVVISGTLTMLLGDDRERVDLGPGGVSPSSR